MLCNNVQVHLGDGSQGWEADAPYNGILVTAAARKVPQPVLNQLADDGRLVIPVGSRMNQDLEVWQRQGDSFSIRSVLAVAFVPLRGELGWTIKEWEESSLLVNKQAESDLLIGLIVLYYTLVMVTRT